MSSATAQAPMPCPYTRCPMESVIAVHGSEIAAMKSDIGSVKGSIDRIQWATVAALGSLVLACFAAIFKLLAH